MRIDWNLMRQIVLAVERLSAAGLPEIAGRSQEEVGYHAHVLIEKGLAEGFSVRNIGHRLPFAFIANLTAHGHEFAELVRNDEQWNAAMSRSQGGGAVTLAILQNLLAHPPRLQADAPNKPQSTKDRSRFARTTCSSTSTKHGERIARSKR